MNSYVTPSATDELLALLHQMARFLSEMVPINRQNGPRNIIQIAATAES